MNRRVPLLLLGSISAALGAGCAIPFASPPVSASLSAAAMSGEATVASRQEPGDVKVATPMATQLKVGIFPGQWWASQFHRLFDVGAAYLLESPGYTPGFSDARHGASVHLALRPLSYPVGGGGQWLRLSVESEVGVLWARRSAGLVAGPGGTLSLGLEWTQFVSGNFSAEHRPKVEPPMQRPERPGQPESDRPTPPDPFHVPPETRDSFWSGAAHGETGIALYLSASHRQLPGEHYWLFGGGLRFRLPASYGLGFWLP